MSRWSPGPRAQAGIVLALVATLGALLGILGDRLVAQQREAPPAMEPPPGRTPGMMRPEMVRGYGQQLARHLDLTDGQRAQIDSILMQERLRVRELNREFQPRFRAVARQTRERVEAVLTPEQRARLGELRTERMRRIGDRPMFRDGRGRPDLP